MKKAGLQVDVHHDHLPYAQHPALRSVGKCLDSLYFRMSLQVQVPVCSPVSLTVFAVCGFF